MKQIKSLLKRHIGICIVIQVIILGMLSIWCLNKERTVIEAPLEKWESWLIEYNGNSWYIDEQTLEKIGGASSVPMIYGPHITLPRGSYIVTVTYSGGADNHCEAISRFGMNDKVNLKGDYVTLEADKTVKSFRIEAIDDIDDFEVQVTYEGTGFLEIQNITICESRIRDVRNIFVLFLCLMALDVFLLLEDKIKAHHLVLIALLSTVCLASLPELVADFYFGHDIYFHLLRIEGIAQELLLGNFPARIHSLSLEGYGYPVSIYYGDVFLYIPALFRMVGFSVIDAYKIYIFLINMVTTCVSYLCFKQIFKERSIAMAGTVAYVTSAYRLLDIYVRAAVGEYTAMLALPIIALALYRIYESDSYHDWKDERKSALLLAVGMSILIGSHILSTEMVSLMLVLICIVLYKKTFRKNTIRTYVLAVMETILLSAYFLIPFLDYWLNVNVNITDTVEKTGIKIQDYGAYIGQYFTFFEGARGLASTMLYGRMQLTPGVTLMGTLVVAVVLWLNGTKNRRWLFYMGFSVGTLWMASNIFPWDYLAARSKCFNLLAQVQYPWRYIGIAVIFLTLLLCELLLWLKESGKGDYKKWSILVIVTSALMTSYMTADIYDTVTNASGIDTAAGMSTYDREAVNTLSIGTEEYLRVGTDIDELSGDIYSENLKTMELRRREGAEIEIYCEADGKEAYVEVPLLNYKGYHVWDDAGNEYEIVDGNNNVIGFSLPAHFVGNITVTFEEPLAWRVAEIVSLLMALALFAPYVRKIKKCIVSKEERTE